MSPLLLITLILLAALVLFWLWMGECLQGCAHGPQREKRMLIRRRLTERRNAGGSPPPLPERRNSLRRKTDRRGPIL